jgi:hypothetical protein
MKQDPVAVPYGLPAFHASGIDLVQEALHRASIHLDLEFALGILALFVTVGI